jgi:hypothetical protein
MTRWHFSIQALRHHSAFVVDGNDIAVGFDLGDLGGTEIEHRPARGIEHPASQRLGQARPRQADPEHRIGKMQRGQPRGAKRPVLLLRVLQDQERDLVFDRRDAVADAQRQRLLALRTIRHRLRGGAHFRLGVF